MAIKKKHFIVIDWKAKLTYSYQAADNFKHTRKNKHFSSDCIAVLFMATLLNPHDWKSTSNKSKFGMGNTPRSVYKSNVECHFLEIKMAKQPWRPRSMTSIFYNTWLRKSQDAYLVQI